MTGKQLREYRWLKREIEADRKRLWSAEEENTKQVADILRKNIVRCMKMQVEIERFIYNIPDSVTRQVFKLRVIDGCSWSRVAMRIGGGNTVDSVISRYNRYLRSQK